MTKSIYNCANTTIMKKILFIILLLSLKVNSQELIGTWEVISYEDEIAYFNKTKDSLFYKNSSLKDNADNFRQMSEIVIFPVSYNFDRDDNFIISHPAMGRISSGKFEVDKSNKKIILIDGEGKKDELSYVYKNEILFVEMEMESGYIKLGLKKS